MDWKGWEGRGPGTVRQMRLGGAMAAGAGRIPSDVLIPIDIGERRSLLGFGVEVSILCFKVEARHCLGDSPRTVDSAVLQCLCVVYPGLGPGVAGGTGPLVA